MSVTQQVLHDLVAAIHAHPSGGLGGTTLVAIDGPAASGKTTLAAQLGQTLPAQVVHMDDLYEGWQGMAAGVAKLHEWVLEPLHAGVPGRYRRYDWELNTYAERHSVPLADYLVVEGCASAGRGIDQYQPFIIWVEEPDAQVRLARGLARDGAHMREHWLDFMAQEEREYQEQNTRAAAHVTLNGQGEPVSGIGR